MRRILAALGVFTTFLVLSAPAHAGHGLKSWLKTEYLDHPFVGGSTATESGPAFQSGGEGAEWETIGTIPTGNPHTDIDFFTQGDEMFASVGTLAIGPNAGGQTIVKLVNADGEVVPEFVTGHPSAACASRPDAALGLQHDVEAAPKGNVIFNETNDSADRSDAQILVDATDQRGRCHDQSPLGLVNSPRGGLEIIDITDVTSPKEIGLTSHVGEAHTVNVDPKRPHIAYAVTSDAVSVSGGVRQNEIDGSGDRFDLDGFEVVDMSSCMYFEDPEMSIEDKRAACRPEVYRYRYEELDWSLGHTQQNSVYGCHELEVYEDDMLTCGSGAAAIAFDMSGAFDEGDPDDPTDDTPNGTPLPCTVRPSLSEAPFSPVTGAQVVDCVDDANTPGPDQDLDIPTWLDNGAPSLEGVEYVGTVHHMGRGGPFPSTEDNDFNHETELTESGRFLLATDERGGGVTPPGASCSTAADNTQGNGGVHAYRMDRLDTDGPAEREEGADPPEWNAYALNSEGEKAIYRAPVRTGAQATVCTAHVFQQIPGQSRIFMGWYSQGTQVIDYTENPDGTIDFEEAGYFIPANTNEWVSHVFKVDKNTDGTFTYYGATGDFNLAERGRNAIDVWKVTMPPPPNLRPSGNPNNPNNPGGGNNGTGGGTGGTGYPLPTGSGKTCMGRRARFVRRGLGRFRLRLRRAVVHRRAGQPGSTRRGRRVYRYCVTRSGGKVILAFDRRNRVRLIASTARGHRRGRIRRGTRARRVARSSRTTKLARNLYASSNRRFVYGTRRGRVRYVAVVDRRVSSRPRALRRYLRLAGLRR